MCYSSAPRAHEAVHTHIYPHTNRQTNKEKISWCFLEQYHALTSVVNLLTVPYCALQLRGIWNRSERKCKKRPVCISVLAYIYVRACPRIYLSFQYPSITGGWERKRERNEDTTEAESQRCRTLIFVKAMQSAVQGVTQKTVFTKHSSVLAFSVAMLYEGIPISAGEWQFCDLSAVCNWSEGLCQPQSCTPGLLAKFVWPALDCCKITTPLLVLLSA